jgi:hypothetical protein
VKRLALILAVAGVAAGCGGTTGSQAPPAAAAPKVGTDGARAASLVISHETQGCHSWSLNGSPFASDQTATLLHGNGITVTNNDVMPHTLVQMSGPAAIMAGLRMAHPAAQGTMIFPVAGTYVFKTVAGEDYPSAAGIQTVGADHVLHLVVHVY